jgi:hypothetical protein
METLLGMHESKSGSTFHPSTDAPWGNIGIKMKRGGLDNSVGEDKYLDQLVPCDEYNFWWDNKECVQFKLGESRDIQHYYNHLCNHPNSYWWKDTDMSIPEGSMDKSNFLPSIFDKVPQTPFTLISQNQYSEIGWKYLIPKEVDDSRGTLFKKALILDPFLRFLNLLKAKAYSLIEEAPMTLLF